MNSKERLLIALNKGIPDRLPVTLHQWQPYHLKYYMGGITPQEAFKECGMDAAVSYFENMGQTQFMANTQSKKFNDEWMDEVEVVDNDIDHTKINHTIYTPKGKLSYKIEANQKTTWITEPLVKNYEDIEILRYLPVPKLDKKDVEKAYNELGDDGILRGFVWGEQAGCWQQACCYFGEAEMIYAAIDEPLWMHRFMSILLEKKLQFIYESLKGAKFDLIETGGGAASSTLISPSIFKEFCLPYDRKIHDALHDIGHKSTYHTCGGMYGIFDLIVETHTDASETLSPRGMGGNIDGPEAYEALHGKVSLIGGMDQFNILTNGTAEQIRNEVYRLFDIYGRGGGYIMAACDHFFDISKENLKAFANAAKECVY